MAFRRMRKRFFGRRAGPSGYHWVGTYDADVSIAAGVLTERIVLASGDFSENTAVSRQGVTVCRCVGFILCRQTTPPTVGVMQANFGLAMVDEDETPTAGAAFDPTVSVQLTDERWLWQSALVWQFATAVGAVAHRIVHFDVKQRVRLRDSGISMIVKNKASSVDNFNFDISCRVLLKGDIT